MVELVQKAKSLLGLRSNAPVIRGLEAVLAGDGSFVTRGMISTGARELNDQTDTDAFRPEQIKSATGNRGTFDPADPNIMFARATAPSSRRARFSIILGNSVSSPRSPARMPPAHTRNTTMSRRSFGMADTIPFSGTTWPRASNTSATQQWPHVSSPRRNRTWPPSGSDTSTHSLDPSTESALPPTKSAR
jgi:hypothetical protein